MKIFKHFLLLFVATGLVLSCGNDDDDDPTQDLAAPSNVMANVSIAQDDTGTVTVAPTATGASSFEVLFGDEDNEQPTAISAGQSATNVYEEGMYTLSVTAIGADGQETTVTEQVMVSFTVPTNLVIGVEVSMENPFEVTVTPTADDATMFAILFGDEADGEEATTIMAGESATNVYEVAGDYTITVTAMGASATTIEGTEMVTIEAPAFDGGLIVNGDFEDGAEPWNAGVEAFDAPPAPVVTEEGNTFYSVTVDNPDPAQPFLVNLSQQGLSLVDGTNYILTFDAWSDRDRSIIAGIGESADSFATTAIGVAITAERQTYALNLTAVGFGGNDLRVLFDSNGEAGLVNIDNVSLFEGGDGSDTPGGNEPTEILVNGDFEAGAEPWNAGVEAFDAPPAPVVTENGNTFYSVTIDTPDPAQPFLVNLSQQGLSLVDGTNYILSFDAWSDRERSIIAGIGESADSFASAAIGVAINTQIQTYTLNLTAAGFGGDDLRVLFDSNGEAGLVNIDNVSLVEGGDGSDTPGNDDGGDDGGDGTNVTLPVDFEDASLNFVFQGFEGADSAIEDNPVSGGSNTSARVMRTIKTEGAQFFAGTFLDLSAAIDFSATQTLTMSTYSPKANIPVRVAIENADGTVAQVFVDADTTVADAWETLSFDFSGVLDANAQYNRIVVFFEFIPDVAGDGSTYYFDNIALGN